MDNLEEKVNDALETIESGVADLRAVVGDLADDVKVAFEAFLSQVDSALDAARAAWDDDDDGEPVETSSTDEAEVEEPAAEPEA